MENFEVTNNIKKSDIDKLIELDKLVYTENDLVDKKLCYEWYRKNKRLWTIIKHNNKIIGYINFMPITDECYKKYKKNIIKEQNIFYDDILNYQPNNNYCFLFNSIVVHPDYHNTKASIVLFHTFYKNTLKFLKENNITIKTILAHIVNEKIEKIVLRNGFKLIYKYNNYKLYEGNISKI